MVQFLQGTLLVYKFMKYDTKFDIRRKLEEEWKTITGWPNYTVSNVGRVYNTKKNRFLKVGTDGHGYPRVYLENERKWICINVHRLVAIEFVDGYFEGAEVNHIDGVKTNNNYMNLEWVTRSENIKHAFKLGLNPTRRVIWKKIER